MRHSGRAGDTVARRLTRPTTAARSGVAPPPPAAAYAAPGYMPPPPGYGQQPPGYGQPPVGQSTNGLAIASLVLGIVWVFGVGSILAVIFGFVAKKQIRESGGRQGGGGMAIAGIVLGFVGVAGLVLWIILAIALTNSINDCFNQTNNSNNPCGITTNTGNSGGLFNSGSTGKGRAARPRGRAAGADRGEQRDRPGHQRFPAAVEPGRRHGAETEADPPCLLLLGGPVRVASRGRR